MGRGGGEDLGGKDKGFGERERGRVRGWEQVRLERGQRAERVKGEKMKETEQREKGVRRVKGVKEGQGRFGLLSPQFSRNMGKV